MNARQTFRSSTLRAYYIGKFFFAKYAARVQDAGTFTVAKQLRKQGVPLEMALFIITGKANGIAPSLAYVNIERG